KIIRTKSVRRSPVGIVRCSVTRKTDAPDRFRWVHPWWVRQMRKLDCISVHTFYRPRNWGDGSKSPTWGDAEATAAAANSRWSTGGPREIIALIACLAHERACEIIQPSHQRDPSQGGQLVCYLNLTRTTQCAYDKIDVTTRRIRNFVVNIIYTTE